MRPLAGQGSSVVPFGIWIRQLVGEHPFELGLSLSLVLFGIRAFLTNLEAVPASVTSLSTVFIYIYCVLSILGGLTVILGMVARYRYVWAYGVECFGLYLSTSAWASYMVGVLFSPISAKSTLFVFSLAALSLGCFVRASTLKNRANVTMEVLRQSHTDSGEADES